MADAEEKQPDTELATILAGQAEDSQEETTEETKDTERQEEEKSEEVVTEEGDKSEELESAEPVITDEMATKHPWMKNFIGKPLDEAFTAYENVQRAYTRSQQMLSEIQKQNTQPKKETEQEPPKPPKLELLSPEERDALVEYIKSVSKAEREQLKKELEPVLQPAVQVSQERARQNILANVQASLPEGVKADEVLKEYAEANRDSLTPEVVDFYDKHLDLFYKEIGNWYNSSHYKAQFEKTSKRVNTEAAKKAAQKIREAEKIKTVNGGPKKAAEQQQKGDPDLLAINQNIEREKRAREG